MTHKKSVLLSSTSPGAVVQPLALEPAALEPTAADTSNVYYPYVGFLLNVDSVVAWSKLKFFTYSSR
jgi:hypothetical protein